MAKTTRQQWHEALLWSVETAICNAWWSEHRCLTVRDLTAQLGVSPPPISNALDELTRERRLVRIRHSSDERRDIWAPPQAAIRPELEKCDWKFGDSSYRAVS